VGVLVAVMTLHGRLAKHLYAYRSYRVVGVVEGGLLVGGLCRDGRGLEVVVLPVAQRRVQQRPMPKRQPAGMLGVDPLGRIDDIDVEGEPLTNQRQQPVGR
jgi:hypothetical protein